MKHLTRICLFMMLFTGSSYAHAQSERDGAFFSEVYIYYIAFDIAFVTLFWLGLKVLRFVISIFDKMPISNKNYRKT